MLRQLRIGWDEFDLSPQCGSSIDFPGHRLPIDNLYLCGTDQGFLGIVGSMLSGITMANNHWLR